jgi:hypothetical protein
MTDPSEVHEVEVEVEGRMAGVATIRQSDDPGVVRSEMHVESGHLPPGTASRLVDAVLDDPQVSAAEQLSASMPAGDTEMIERVRERAESVEVHRAGATKQVEAELRHPS